MNILYFILAFLLILLVTVFAVLLFSTIVFNMKVGARYRARLAQQLGSLRLSKMLTALGIDTNTYLHSQRVVDINNHMERCLQCDNTDQCDDNIESDTVNTENIKYCSNESSLKDIIATEISTKHQS